MPRLRDGRLITDTHCAVASGDADRGPILATTPGTKPSGGLRRVLGREASFRVAAAVVAHALWTSAAPVLTYRIYIGEWHLSAAASTGIFAVYPVAVAATLFLFRSVSERLGKRRLILLGVASSLVGALSLALASGIGWVLAGRFFMGIGVGLSATPATAALVEFGNARGPARANAVGSAAAALGLGMAAVVGGVLIEYAPFPTRLNFCVLGAGLAMLLVACWFLPRDGSCATHRGSWSRGRALRGAEPQMLASAALAVTAGLSMGSIVLSIGAQVAHDLVGSGNSLVNGGAIALFALSSGVVSIAGQSLAANRSLTLGGSASATGMALLLGAASTRSLPGFLAAVALCGAAYSLLFVGGIALIDSRTPPPCRTAALSFVYLTAYLLMALLGLGLGGVAVAWGMRTSLDVFAPVLEGLGIACVAFAVGSDKCRRARRVLHQAAVPGCPAFGGVARSRDHGEGLAMAASRPGGAVGG